MYIRSLVKYKRRKTIEVNIGNVPLGGDNPIRIQTMLNTDTNDIEACIEQSIRCIKAGAEYIRITAQGEKEAYNLAKIKEGLKKRGYQTPLIADIHFNPKAAEIAATIVEKVRINPGNYTDKKRLKPEELTEEQYKDEIERIKKRFLPLLEICKKYNTAIRIGTNHGSLSDRIMGRFGDTPEGMAESAMEFLRICKETNFQDVVLSMKASNVKIMVYASRLLVKKMLDEDMLFPLHLGVTEAGDGEDGRIKSAVGIGALLADGIGDTIRVSLTEDPECEIPVAEKIASCFENLDGHKKIVDIPLNPINHYEFNKRSTRKTSNIGGGQPPVVIADLSNVKTINENTFIKLGFEKKGERWTKADQSPDFIFCGNNLPEFDEVPVGFIVDHDILKIHNIKKGYFPYFDHPDFGLQNNDSLSFLAYSCNEITEYNIQQLKTLSNAIIILNSKNENKLADFRAAMIRLINTDCKLPVIFRNSFGNKNPEQFQVSMASELGGLFIDGLGDGIILSAFNIDPEKKSTTSFQILQSTGDRITKTEYISCPSCGRTHFDLQETLAKIKAKTSHLKGLKIGVMSCIVNRPGEMADAHYGYVGAGKGKVTLYKNKEVVKRNIPSDEAVDKLIDLIKQNGDWIEK